MDEEMRGKCEVLACTKQSVTEPHRKKPDRASEVHNSLGLHSPKPYLFLVYVTIIHVTAAMLRS